MIGHLIYSPRGRNAIASFLFASVAIVSGQTLLFKELASFNLAHCQKINIQKIFFLNQLAQVEMHPSNEGRSLKVSEFAMPNYCERYIPTRDLYQIKRYAKGSSIYDAEAILRLLGDCYSKAEALNSSTQLSLLIMLMVSNSLSLILLCVNLYEDSRELHDV